MKMITTSELPKRNQKETDSLKWFVDSFSFPLVVLDDRLRIAQTNAACSEIFPLDELCAGSSLDDLRRWIHAPDLSRELEQVIDSGREYRAFVRAGKNVAYELHATPYRQSENRICGALLWLRDVSAERIAQPTLTQRPELHRRAAEGRYFRLIADGVTDYAIFLLDREGRVASWNAGAERIKGYEKEEILRRPISVFYTQEDLAIDKPATLLGQAKEQGRVETEGWRICKDGSRFFADVVITAIRDPAGKLVGFLKITRDMTERKRAEQMLRENEERVRGIIDTMPEAVLVVNEQGRIVQANRISGMIFGFDQADLVGKPVESLIPERFRAGHVRMRRAYASDPKIRMMGSVADLYGVHRDGHEFPVEVALSPLSHGETKEIVVAAVDISARKAAEEALRTSEGHLKTLLDTASDGIHVLDQNGDMIEFSQSFARMLGYTPEETAKLNVADWDACLPRGDVVETVHRLISKPGTFETKYRRKDGSIIDAEINATGIELAGRVCLYASARDITDRKSAEIEQRQAASVFANTLDGVVIADATGVVIRVNPAFEQILGYANDDIAGRHVRMMHTDLQDDAFYDELWNKLRIEGRWQGEAWGRHKECHAVPTWLSICALYNVRGEVDRYIGTFHDISEQKASQERIQRLAHYDALTGLPNRVLLEDRLKQAMAATRRTGKLLAVCYLDLDGFKPVNDTYGHAIGDALLVQVAERLNSVVRDADSVARIGGDEFVILLNNLSGLNDCQTALHRVRNRVSETYRLDDKIIENISVSVGVTLYPTDDSGPDKLLCHADQAMYVVKQSGRRDFYVFDAERS